MATSVFQVPALRQTLLLQLLVFQHIRPEMRALRATEVGRSDTAPTTMNDAPRPKRGWYQFSLRTMFVFVTLASAGFGWLGSQISWVRERRRVIEDRREILHATFVDEPVPWPLWLIMEDGWGQINYPTDLPDERRAELMRLFPEARFVPGPYQPSR
jgi:hypothetical protein